MKSALARIEGGAIITMIEANGETTEYQNKLPPNAAEAIKKLDLADEDQPPADQPQTAAGKRTGKTLEEKAGDILARDVGWRNRLGVTYGARADHPTFCAAVHKLASILAKEEVDASGFGKARAMQARAAAAPRETDTVSRMLAKQARGE